MTPVDTSSMKRMLSGHHSQTRPPRPMNGIEASDAGDRQATRDTTVDALDQARRPRQVVGQHEREERQGETARIEQCGQGVVQQVLVDVVDRHQDQAEPLQRFERAALDAQERQGRALPARAAWRPPGLPSPHPLLLDLALGGTLSRRHDRLPFVAMRVDGLAADDATFVVADVAFDDDALRLGDPQLDRVSRLGLGRLHGGCEAPRPIARARVLERRAA